MSDAARVRVVSNSDSQEATILMHPQPFVAVAGETSRFRVQMSGEGWSYQWLKNGQPLAAAASRLSGVEGPELEIAHTGAEDTGLYAVRVSRGGNPGPVVSQGASLAVVLPPTIVEQPKSVLVSPGQRVVLSAQAEGHGDVVRYQWKFRRSGQASLELPLAGGALQSVEMRPVSEGDDGLYWVEATNRAGTTRSEVVRVQVRDAVQIHEVTPSEVSADPGATVRLSVRATGDGLQYQWYRMLGRVEAALAGRTEPDLVLTHVGAGRRESILCV
jgi:hypothetical protein